MEPKPPSDLTSYQVPPPAPRKIKAKARSEDSNSDNPGALTSEEDRIDSMTNEPLPALKIQKIKSKAKVRSVDANSDNPGASTSKEDKKDSMTNEPLPAPKIQKIKSKAKVRSVDANSDNPGASTSEEDRKDSVTYEPPPGYQVPRQSQETEPPMRMSRKKSARNSQELQESQGTQPVVPFTTKPKSSLDKPNKDLKLTTELQPTEGEDLMNFSDPNVYSQQKYEYGGKDNSQNRQQLKMSRVNIRNCLADTNCDMNIILGQREQDHVKAVGQELLLMGKRVLNEIDFVENLIVEECSAAGAPCDDPCGPCAPRTMDFQCGCQCPPLNNKRNPRMDNYCPQREVRKVNVTDSEKWISDIERSKQEFIEAFGKICYSIGQAKENRMKSSQPQPPKLLSEGAQLNPNVKIRSRKLLAPDSSMSTCVAGDEGCFQQITRANSEFNYDAPNDAELDQNFQHIADRLTQLEMNFSELDDQVGELINTVLKQNTGMTNKIASMEDDILYMAKLIHELQCVTKLQMHVGNMDQNTRS